MKIFPPIDHAKSLPILDRANLTGAISSYASVTEDWLLWVRAEANRAVDPILWSQSIDCPLKK